MNIDRLVRNELMSTRHPPTEMSLPFHPFNFFWKCSSTSFHSELLSFLWCIGMPRYLNENFPCLHLKIWEYFNYVCLTTIAQELTFMKVNFEAKESSNAHSTSFMFII
jgi:hypothetical protein